MAASTAEERVARISNLLRELDGIDAVVVAYEGLPYSVHAVDPEARKTAEELAAKAPHYLASLSSTVIGGEPESALAEKDGKSILVVSVGGGFQVVAVGLPAVLRSVAPSLRRIVGGSELSCPRCGASLDVLSFTCPNCGKRIPFTSAYCPFCMSLLPTKTCPSCGGQVAATPEGSGVIAAAPMAGRERLLGTTSKLVIGSVSLVSYALAAWGLGIGVIQAVLLGIVPLAVIAGLLAMK